MPGHARPEWNRGKMKRFLLKSKQEPVTARSAWVTTRASRTGAVAASLRQSLQGDLQKQFPSAFDTRFGTAVVDTDDDPTLVVHARPAGRQHGAPAGQDAEGHRLPQGAVCGTARRWRSRPRRRKSASPPTGRLWERVPARRWRLPERLRGSCSADQGRRRSCHEGKAGEARATDANVNIKTNNLTYAATYLAQLRNGITTQETVRGQQCGWRRTHPAPPPPRGTGEAQPLHSLRRRRS